MQRWHGGGDERIYGLSGSQITRRVKVMVRAAGLADWESFSGHSGRVGMARRMAQNGTPTHELERQGRWKQGGSTEPAGLSPRVRGNPSITTTGYLVGFC